MDPIFVYYVIFALDGYKPNNNQQEPPFTTKNMNNYFLSNNQWDVKHV